MRCIAQRDTAPEQLVRKVLTELGAHFRTHIKTLPGSPDVVNQSEGWVVMINGCFWHGHDCDHGRVESKTNSQKWRTKITENRERDRRKRAQLECLGFKVEDVWECELGDVARLSARLLQFLNSARARLESFVFDSKDGTVARRVNLANNRVRTTRLVYPQSLDELSPADAYDLAWLRSSNNPPASRNGIGSISCVDLFSGCGGLSLGVMEACHASGRHFRPLLAMEANRHALTVYQDNFRAELALDGNLTQYVDGVIGTPRTYAEQNLIDQLDQIDILVAGPPCQGHSNLNNYTRRNDDRNDLYLRVARFAEIAKPRYVVVENVASVVHDVRGSLAMTRKILEDIGYTCDEKAVDLSRIGVPQLRKRHVLVASQERVFDIATVVSNHAVTKQRSVDWAIGDLANYSAKTLLDTPRKLSAENLSRIQWLFENGKYDLPNEHRPRCHQGEHSYYAMYGRLRPDLPANTITTGFGSPGQGRYIHPTLPRTITAHEAARLQMFPDFFDFSAAHSYEELSKMIGNAVPMKLSYLLTLALFRE